MKLLNVVLFFMSASAPCFCEVWEGALLEIRDVSTPGIAIAYSGKNPLDAICFSEEDSQILNPFLRFKNIEKDSLRVVSSGNAKFEFRKNEITSGADLQHIRGFAPSKKETKEWIKTLRNAIETKNARQFCLLYFSDAKGTNPDLEILFPEGRKKMSEMVKTIFDGAQKIEIQSRIKFCTGKNYTMIFGETGKILLSVDGNETWLVPVFISKKSPDAAIETL